MNDPSTRRTQQQRRETTELRVLEAAVQLVVSDGPKGLSLARVGRAAGYSRAIVTHRFGSRRALLDALVVHAQTFAVPATDGTGLDAVSALVSTYLDRLQERGSTSTAFLLLWAEALSGDRDLAEIFDDRDTWFRGLLADLVRSGLTDGSIRDDADPDVYAVLLVGLLRGVALQLIGGQQAAESLPHIGSEAAAATRRMLRPKPATDSSA